MLISELMEKLGELQGEYGDVEVHVYTIENCCQFKQVTRVEIDCDGDLVIS